MTPRVDAELDALIRAVDGLEQRAPGDLTLDEVRATAVKAALLDRAVIEGVLLVDQRLRIVAPDSTAAPVTLCRLNRQHPLVRAATREG